MRVALVTPSSPAAPAEVDPETEKLAHALAARGEQVEVLLHGGLPGDRALSTAHGVRIWRVPSLRGRRRSSAGPGLTRRLELMAGSHDIVDLRSDWVPLAVAVSRARFRTTVFTPGLGIERLLKWPHAHLMRAVFERASHVVCASAVERAVLCRRFPGLIDRTSVIAPGVDPAAVLSATPFSDRAGVVLAVGRLDKSSRIDRAIAAMSSLDESYRLVVLGTGSGRERLEAYARDLRVASRVEFIGTVNERDLHRWLRTAEVMVALANGRDSISAVLPALAAGVPVVASDIPAHQEALTLYDSDRLFLVAADGSPLRLADAISGAAALGPCRPATSLPSTSSAIEATWDLYTRLVHESSDPGAKGRRPERRAAPGPVALDTATKHVRHAAPLVSTSPGEGDPLAQPLTPPVGLSAG